MSTTTDRERTRRWRDARVGVLRRRFAIGSVLAFAGLVGLASQHAVGSSKRRAGEPRAPSAATARTTFFDEGDQGFEFDDSGVATPLHEPAQTPAPAAQPTPPPVAQTGVS